MKKLLALSLLVLASACRSDSIVPIDCPEIARPGISLIALDRATAEPVRVKGTLVVREGSFAETATNAPPVELTFYAAYERPGTYTVTLEIPGYETWRLDGVVVNANKCSVNTVPLAAQISKSG